MKLPITGITKAFTTSSSFSLTRASISTWIRLSPPPSHADRSTITSTERTSSTHSRRTAHLSPEDLNNHSSQSFTSPHRSPHKHWRSRCDVSSPLTYAGGFPPARGTGALSVTVAWLQRGCLSPLPFPVRALLGLTLEAWGPSEGRGHVLPYSSPL